MDRSHSISNSSKKKELKNVDSKVQPSFLHKKNKLKSLSQLKISSIAILTFKISIFHKKV